MYYTYTCIDNGDGDDNNDDDDDTKGSLEKLTLLYIYISTSLLGMYKQDKSNGGTRTCCVKCVCCLP